MAIISASVLAQPTRRSQLFSQILVSDPKLNEHLSMYVGIAGGVDLSWILQTGKQGLKKIERNPRQLPEQIDTAFVRIHARIRATESKFRRAPTLVLSTFACSGISSELSD